MEERKWPGPKGMIPEPDRNAADANMHNRRYLDELLVEMRVIDAFEPDLTLNLFNETFAALRASDLNPALSFWYSYLLMAVLADVISAHFSVMPLKFK
jgi:hypothetical protein